MKLSEGVEWCLHCACVLALLPEGSTVPGGRLAEFHGVPSAYLVKHLQALRRSGVVESTPGKGGGYRLARAPSAITLWDVVCAVEGSAPAFRCTEIRRQGTLGGLPIREYRAACTITRVMHEAEAAWRAELRGRTLAELVAQLPTAFCDVVMAIAGPSGRGTRVGVTSH
ncbi:MAG: RrF2 family transcriptional regulator [Acidimicrobiia bacterium]